MVVAVSDGGVNAGVLVAMDVVMATLMTAFVTVMMVMLTWLF